MSDMMSVTPAVVSANGSSLRIEPLSIIARSGQVVQGSSEVDENPVTGSVLPVLKAPGDRVLAGSRNGAGPLEISPDADQFQIADQAQAYVPRERQAEGNSVDGLLARFFGPFLRFWIRKLLICAVAGILAGLTWMIMQSRPASPSGVFCLLVGLLPPGLLFVWPSQWLVARQWLRRHGMICRDPAQLVRLRYAAGFLFGRSGTLSQGQLRIVSLQPAGNTAPADFVTLVASAHQTVEDIWGRAILAFGISHRIRLRPFEDVVVEPGAGLSATVDGRRVIVGRQHWVEQHGIDTTLLAEAIQEHTRLGRQMLVAAVISPQPTCLGILALADPPKRGAVDLIRLCKGSGIETILIADPGEKATTVLSGLLGVDRVVDPAAPMTELDPERIVAIGRSNDHKLLTHFERSIAFGDAAIAQNPATVFGLRREDPRHILDFVILSQTLARRLPISLFVVWMTGWPVAAAGLGLIWMPPQLVAICIGAGIVIAILQALLLRLLGSLVNDEAED
jgi:cation transport ATPase